MEKNKKIILWGNVVLGILLVISTVVFMETSINKYITKTTTSSIFVLTGLFNLIMLYRLDDVNNKWKALILFIGLVFAMVGDIVLIEYFVLGALFFAIGHIFFLVYLCLLYKFKWVDVFIILTILILIYLFICLYKGFDFKGMKTLIVVYATVIGIMLGKAIGNFISNNTKANLITAIGAFLFFFSDLMLLFYVFANNLKIFDRLCVYSYYPATFLLALSVVFQYKAYKKRM